MPTMSFSHKMKLLSNFVLDKRFREIYNMFWVYPLWWNRKWASFLLNKFFPKLGIGLFPPFLEIEPTTVCNFRCICCIPENSLILGSEPKTIQDINKKDYVYGSKGEQQIVSQTFNRYYQGKLIKLNARGILPFSVTPEHRVLVTRRIWKEKPRKDRKYEYSKEFEFISAKNLNQNYALVFPKLRDSRKIEEINGIKISKDLMRFLGLYIAEGYTCTSKRTLRGKVVGNHRLVRFVFGKHEQKLINETCELITKIFNNKYSIIQTKTSTDVCFSSVQNAKWISEFGNRATKKRVPNFIMQLEDKELIKEFLDGFIDGDGYINEKYIQLTTSSRILALQLQKLLSRLDIFGRLYVNKRAGDSIIQGRKVKINDLYNVRITCQDFYKFTKTGNTSKKNRNFYGESKNYFFLPLTKISKEDYLGKVYNLETGDKTFELNSIVIHNCEHSYWKEPSKNMSFEQFKKVFDQFGKPKWLGLTGIGSSYLNKDYHKMLAHAKSKGTIIEVFDHFAHFKDDAQIKELIKIGPDFQFISTYGASKNSFEKVCVGSDYKKIEENIKKFVKFKKQMKKRFPILNFHYIITNESKEEVFPFLDFIHSLNTDIGEVLVTPMLHNFKEAEKYAVDIDKEYVEKVREWAKKYRIPITINWSANQEAIGAEKKPQMNCCKEYIMPFIFVTGHVTPCCGQNEANQRDWQKKMSPGNVFEKSMKKIWYGKEYKKIRKMIRANKCPKECSLCPAYEKNFDK